MVDGVILARIINMTKPGTINESQLKLDLHGSNRSLFEQTTNLELVLQGARSLGCKVCLQLCGLWRACLASC